MDLEPDARRYRILDVIGRGGFGTVYRGEAHGSGGFVKEVALKVLHPHVEANPEQLARLREEARMLALLKHRAIVGVDTLTRMHDRWTVVMEYVPGVTVRDLLEHHGPLSLSMALEVAAQVASALEAAYRATGPDGQPLRLLHRDVKPSNVQITRWGEVKLLDFGVARAETPSREIQTGSVVYGSVPYLAPERLALRDTHQADVYALALTTVQMLTGAVPKPGAPNPERIAEARRLLEEVAAPATLVALIERSLAFEPEDRPDARAFELEIKRVARLLTLFDPREWAESHVGSILDGRPPAVGELTGMSFAEGSASVSLQDLVGGTRAAATFDDPADPPPEQGAPLIDTPGPGPRGEDDDSTGARPGAALAEPAPDASGPVFPELPGPPLPSRPALRGGRRRGGGGGAVAIVLVSILGLGGLAGGALLVTAVGTSTAALAGIVGALFWSPGMCVSFVDTTRDNAREGGHLHEVAGLLDDAETACDAGEISAWQVNALDLRIGELSKDGEVSEADLTKLRRMLEQDRHPR